MYVEGLIFQRSYAYATKVSWQAIHIVEKRLRTISIFRKACQKSQNETSYRHFVSGR